tara:strand:- start:18161 stop:18793 length:633 start_codon:yes stop_codon:yes gene_type:complete
MTSARKSIINCYVKSNDVYSQQVRIVLAEKGVAFNIKVVDTDEKMEELKKINSYGELPTLVDRDLVLYNSKVILEYLDERFPHPPLLPVYPILRAKARLTMARIEQDWYSKLNGAENSKSSDVKESLIQELIQEINELSAVFEDSPYFLNKEFSLLDCYLVPMFFKLEALGVNLDKSFSKSIIDYLRKISERSSIKTTIQKLEAKEKDTL